MLFRSLAASALLFASAAFAFPAQLSNVELEPRQTTASNACPASGLHIIAVSGDGATGTNNYGLLINLTSSVLNAIPGTTNVSVPYNRNATNKLIATTQGSVNFTNYMNEFHASCPCTKVAVIGYSSGAIISMNALCGASSPWTSPATGFDSSYADYIVAVIAYGDETRTQSAPYNLGTCQGNGRFPRTTADAACPVFADRIQSYCDYSDPECCLGTVNATHYVYDKEYDGDSTQFIKSRYEAFGDVCKSTSTTSSTTHSSTPSTTAVSITHSEPSTTPVTTHSTTPVTTDPTTPVTTVTTHPTTVVTTTAAPSTHADPPATTTTPADPPATTTTAPADPPAPTHADPPATTTASDPAPSTAACPTALSGDWQFPHLIVPVSSASPDTAYGTSYDGTVSSTVSSIFNFDIPYFYAGKTCTLFFSLPLESQLQWSSYTTSGGPGASFGLLGGVATEQTTYGNMPAVSKAYGDFVMTPGSSFVVDSAPCAANERISYLMAATGDYALTYFQAYGDHPIGLYMTAC